MVFGENLDLLNACVVVADAIAERAYVPSPWLWRLPTAKNRRVNAAIQAIHEFVEPFMKRKQQVRHTNSLYFLFLQAYGRTDGLGQR
jgi:hypothetical protein